MTLEGLVMYIRYKYYISVRRADDSLHTVVQKTRGNTDPNSCLARAFSALGQLIRSDDISFKLEIREKGTDIPTFLLISFG